MSSRQMVLPSRDINARRFCANIVDSDLLSLHQRDEKSDFTVNLLTSVVGE